MHNVCVYKFCNMPSGGCQNKASQLKQLCYQQIAADPNKSMSVWLVMRKVMVSHGKRSVQLSTPDIRGDVIAFWPQGWINRCFTNKNPIVCPRKSKRGKRSLTGNTSLELKAISGFVSKLTRHLSCQNFDKY